MHFSSQFATSPATPEHIAISEKLGYDRSWLFDIPHQGPELWTSLALAAERTQTIGLGPAVIVPALRHPMVTASGAATLATLAPGRVALAFGTGFSGARAMGAKASTWAYLRRYVVTVRGLLAGDTVDWDGGRMRMLHPPGYAPPRPLDIPILVSALGPKGVAVASDIADGLFSVNNVTTYAHQFPWAALGIHGTVLAEDEPLDAPRVRDAAGPGNALAYHADYEFGADVTELPAGQAWLDAINRTPELDRHLVVHDQHLVGLNAADEAAWAAGSWAAIPQTTLTGTASDLRRRLGALAEAGITEIVYQPAGSDIPGELEAFIDVARTVTA
jgi:5,10-methylenetetrahydromethanopterin reductase